jgi:hypothetical protein
MFAHEPNAIRLAKRISIGLIVFSVLLSIFLPREWMPRIRGVGRGPELLLLFAIPMAALLLAYEITRAISSSLACRRMAKARDQEFLKRFSRPSRQDHPND